ncbi:MAG: hypothetical protein ABJA66_13020 [Actinomycetota bacterium]
MKKSLLGLAVAIIAFLLGILAAGVFRIEEKTVSVPVSENIPVEEVETDEFPVFNVEPMVFSGKTKSVDNTKFQKVHGWYSHDDYGKMPEIGMINLFAENYDDDGNLIGKINLYAGIYTTLSEDIDEGFAEAEWSTLNGNQIKFKTKKLKGIVYQFEGTFFKNKTMGEYDEKLLRGRLQKFVKGKKVAEVSGDFTYTKPYCLH